MAKKKTNEAPIQVMEHVTIIEVHDGLLRMTADKGWLLKSKRSGHTHTTLTTKQPDRFEVVEA